jgi:hypothetical protein
VLSACIFRLCVVCPFSCVVLFCNAFTFIYLPGQNVNWNAFGCMYGILPKIVEAALGNTVRSDVAPAAPRHFSLCTYAYAPYVFVVVHVQCIDRYIDNRSVYAIYSYVCFSWCTQYSRRYIYNYASADILIFNHSVICSVFSLQARLWRARCSGF